MTILYRYVAKSVALATLLVLVTVAGLIFFLNFLGELRDIGVGDYGIVQAFLHVVLLLPHGLYELFPMITLLGGVLGLGILASHQELMVMRTSGVSVLRLASAVLVAALAIILVVTLLGEMIAPQASHLAESRKNSLQNNGQAIATKAGVWVHQGNDFLQINQVVGRNHLQGVTWYQFNAKHLLQAAYYAASADFKNGKWTLHNMAKTSFNNDQTSNQHLSKTTWDFPLNTSLLNVGLVEPSQLSLHHLSKYTKYLTDNGLQADHFQLEFWKRISKPLTALVMILLAIPFALSIPRSATMGWRIMLGIFIGFLFYISNAFLAQLSIVLQISPLLAALLPTVLFASVGYIFMLRIRT